MVFVVGGIAISCLVWLIVVVPGIQLDLAEWQRWRAEIKLNKHDR